jgi:hypothetical protein
MRNHGDILGDIYLALLAPSLFLRCCQVWRAALFPVGSGRLSFLRIQHCIILD